MDAFIIYILISIFTPGPNNLFASASSSKIGVRKTLPFMFGVLVGTFLVFLATGLFNVILYAYVPMITKLIGVLGGMFILYLAAEMIMASKDESKMMITNGKYFIMAILLTLINPKALIFGLTVATFYLTLEYEPSGIIVLSVINAALCFVSVVVWGYAGHLLKRVMYNHRVAFNIIMALLLAYSGIIVIIESI